MKTRITITPPEEPKYLQFSEVPVGAVFKVAYGEAGWMKVMVRETIPDAEEHEPQHKEIPAALNLHDGQVYTILFNAGYNQLVILESEIIIKDKKYRD